MMPLHELLLFSGTALLLAVSPGPNMVYLLSRSICQGRQAGVISLVGVFAGFLVHICAAAIGVSALYLAIPVAYVILKWMGALYLLWLAWQALKPNATSPFQAQDLPDDSPSKLILMGFLTSALNPKIAVFYVSIFPQFISPQYGSIFFQGIELGLTQIFVSSCVNLTVIFSAAGLASWFTRHPLWLKIQRYVMGGVLAGLAVRLALEQRKNT